MITLIEKIIKDKISDFAEGDVGAPLSFLKYSTPSSGKKLTEKEIFLVFKSGASEPFLCIKTVRNYSAKDIVIQNFNNLKKLNTLTTGSSYKNLFAKALYLHDDGEIIFSIETACPGKKVKLNKNKLDMVVKEYVGFQEYVAKNNTDFIGDMESFVKDIVVQSGLKEVDKQEILQFMELLPLTGIKLPRLVQHGDVTQDNILLFKDSIGIIDCDFVGFTYLPGFDLFGLFSRFDQSKAKKLCYEYLPEYFTKIGADLGGNKYEGLFFLYYFIEHILRKPYLLDGTSAKKIIFDFENIFS